MIGLIGFLVAIFMSGVLAGSGYWLLSATLLGTALWVTSVIQ